jgi:hypothetical protein
MSSTTGSRRRSRGPADLFEPGEVETGLLSIKEEQVVERLPVRGWGDMPVGGKVGEVRLDLRRTHLARMAHAVMAHKGADPMDVLLVRA